MLSGPSDLRKRHQAVHVVILNGEAEHVQVLAHALRRRRLRQRQNPALQGEPDTDLSHGYLVFVRQLDVYKRQAIDIIMEIS